MLHLSKTKADVPAHAAANHAAGKGKALPAVPAFQKKDEQQLLKDDTTQLLSDGQTASIVQRKPADWVRSAKIAEVLTHQPGYFSTWKKIVAAINEYKQLRENQYVQRDEKLKLMNTLIAEWKEGHKSDTTTPRVVGIRGILPDLEDLIGTEQEEVDFAVAARAYATEGNRYVSRARAEVSFSVAKQGQKFNIVSADPRIAGNIEYEVTGTTIELKHFEAQPEGLGLGSVLMHEFADFANQMGVRIVDVQMAALSAMGAYEAFGGVPRAENQEAFNRRNVQYAGVMGLSQNEEQGEHIAADHGDSTYDNFINEEAKAIGKTKANKAQFDRPEINAEDLERVRAEAEQAHKDRNVRSVANVKRVARLKALSGFLSYDIPALFNKTNQMMAGKWDIEEQ